MKYTPAGGGFMAAVHASMLTFAERALITAYSYLTGPERVKALRYLIEGFSNRPMILDSGVYSLSKSGNAMSKAEVWNWAKKYVQLIRDTKFPGLVIDVDCHILLPEWREILPDLRKYMHDQIGDRLVVIWHTPEGFSGWEKVSATYPRVGYNIRDTGSIRELAKVKTGVDPGRLGAVRLLEKRAGCNINDKHVHILGVATGDVFNLPDNYTVDSSTWAGIIQYGRSFYKTNFPVYWWRRDKIEAPPVVIEAVQAKMDLLYENYWKSPEASKKAPDPKYTYALACSLVASNMMCEAIRKKTKARNGHVKTEA